MMLPAAEFTAVMSRHGIGEGSRVVLYSRGPLMWATRVWWMLHAMGFDEAAVLDGGFERWLAEGRPVSTSPEATRPRASSRARARASSSTGRRCSWTSTSPASA